MIFYLFLLWEDITFSFFPLSCCKFIKRESYWISPKLSPLKKLKATTLRWGEGTVGKHTRPTCEDLSSHPQYPYKKWHGMCTRNPALVGGEKSILGACWSAVLNQNSEFCRFSEILSQCPALPSTCVCIGMGIYLLTCMHLIHTRQIRTQ